MCVVLLSLGLWHRKVFSSFHFALTLLRTKFDDVLYLVILAFLES